MARSIGGDRAAVLGASGWREVARARELALGPRKCGRGNDRRRLGAGVRTVAGRLGSYRERVTLVLHAGMPQHAQQAQTAERHTAGRAARQDI